MCKVMCLGCSHVGTLCHSGQMRSLVRSRDEKLCPIVGLIWQWFMCVNMYVWMCELVPSSRLVPPSHSFKPLSPPFCSQSITVSPVSLSLPFSSIISVTVALRCSPPIVAGVKISPLSPSPLPLSSTNCGLSLLSLKLPCSPQPAMGLRTHTQCTGIVAAT